MALATMGTNFIMCFLTSFMMVSHPISRPNFAVEVYTVSSIFDKGVLTNEKLVLNCI